MNTGDHALNKPLARVERVDGRPVQKPRADSSHLKVVVDRDSNEYASRERRRALRERLKGAPIPSEFILSDYEVPVYDDLREAGYAVYTSLDRSAKYQVPNGLVGIYIDHEATSDKSSVRTRAYHRLTPGEQEMLRTAPHFGPVHIGRPSERPLTNRRIEFTAEDVHDGTVRTISETHLQYGASHVLMDSSTFGGTHLVCETPDVALRAPILQERIRNREMYPSTPITNGEFARVHPKNPTELHAVASLFLAGAPSRNPADFLAQTRGLSDIALVPLNRAQMRQAIDRLRWHVLQPPTEPDLRSVVVVEDHARLKSQYLQDQLQYARINAYREQLVRSLEQVLNPLVAGSIPSIERTREWKEHIRANAKYAPEAEATYQRLLTHLDHVGDWSQQLPDLSDVTRDNGFQERYRVWQEQYAQRTLSSEARQELAQLNHAYHRWLENAVAFFQKQQPK